MSGPVSLGAVRPWRRHRQSPSRRRSALTSRSELASRLGVADIQDTPSMPACCLQFPALDRASRRASRSFSSRSPQLSVPQSSATSVQRRRPYSTPNSIGVGSQPSEPKCPARCTRKPGWRPRRRTASRTRVGWVRNAEEGQRYISFLLFSSRDGVGIGEASRTQTSTS